MGDLRPGRWQRKHCHEAAPATHIPRWLDWLWFFPLFAYVFLGVVWLYVVVPLMALSTYPMQHWPVEGETLLRRIGNHVSQEVEEHRPRGW